LLSDGTYGLAATWLWQDAQGNEHYGAPRFLGTVTLSGGTSTQEIFLENVTGPVPYMFNNGFTEKDDVKVITYRTVDSGTVYYVANVRDNEPTLTAFSGTNELNSVDDSDLISNAVLRTTGGILEPTAPPAPFHVATENDYSLLIPADDREAVWQSTPFEENVAVEWSNALVARFPAGGPNVAIEFLDGRPILFKENEIRQLVGTPANARGVGGFTEARLISSDVGCSERRSIVRTKDGILFQSTKGIYLLDRSLQLTYIGSPVEDFNSVTLNSGVLLEDERQVRFTMEADGAAGINGKQVLIWDYYHNNWSVFEYAYSGSQAAVAAVVWDGKWSYCQTDGEVARDSDTLFADNDGPFPVVMELRTAWIKVGALNGFQRLRRIEMTGRHIGNADQDLTLNMRIYRNYDEVGVEFPVQLINASAITVSAPAANRPVTFRAHLSNQKMTAVQIGIVFTAGLKATEGFRFTGLTLEAAVKRKGVRPLGSSNTF
jgi:hypothetical protein